MDDTLNWVLNIFRISKNDSNNIYRIPNLADSQSWGIPEFWETLNGFCGIPVKIQKNLGKFMDFQSCSQSISHKISKVVHGGGGGHVDIFCNSPFVG